MQSLRSAVEHFRAQQRIAASGLAAARRARNLSSARLAQIVAAYQVAGAQESIRAVPAMLAEQGIPNRPEAAVNPLAFGGTASDGRPLSSLLEIAQQERGAAFDLIVLTQMQDMARMASFTSIGVRRNVQGYVRMLEPPSCSRCAVLAGKFYRTNTGFQRHPKCDCRHIPTSENIAGDLTTDPKAYFDSLGGPAQESIFTKAGAKAIRSGADISQVVNARAGMSTAQVVRGAGDRWTASGRAVRSSAFGQKVSTTTEGMTKRGLAYKVRGRNYVRLMPESIAEIAGGNYAEYLRLLKAHGYIL